MKELRLKTWSCSCGYKQDFEPTDELNAVHFRGLPHGVCPSCKVGELLAVDEEAKCALVTIAEIGDAYTDKSGVESLHTKDTIAKANELAELDAKKFDVAEAEAWNVTPWEGAE